MTPRTVRWLLLAFLSGVPSLAFAQSNVITTVAGGGIWRYPDQDPGDGLPATQATFDIPFGIALDAAGNLFVAGVYRSRIRRVNAADGIIRTVAGGGTPADGIGGGVLATAR